MELLGPKATVINVERRGGELVVGCKPHVALTGRRMHIIALNPRLANRGRTSGRSPRPNWKSRVRESLVEEYVDAAVRAIRGEEQNGFCGLAP